jgi:hypothetical protein
VEGGRALQGRKEFPFTGSATAEGIAIYDAETQSMQSLLLVFGGRVWRGRTFEAPEQGGRETGGVVEWSLEPSAEKQNP